MQLIRIEKKTKSKIDQAKTLLSIFCLLSEIKLSQSELAVLAYFLVYGINEDTKNLILKSDILSFGSLNNTMSRLIKFGLIKKSDVSKQYSLSPKINIKPESQLGMLIKIDNS